MLNPIKTAVICVFAVLFNILTVLFFFDTLHLPLFMDTIFSVAVVFYCGLIPGLIVQITYNILNSFIWFLKLGNYDFFILMYTLCGILIIISTWLIAKNKEEFKISPSITLLYLILISLISSACSIITGGIIDYFHLTYQNIPDAMSPIKTFTDSFVRQHIPLLASCILAQIPVSFADRLISTFAGYGVFLLAERIMKGRK